MLNLGKMLQFTDGWTKYLNEMVQIAVLLNLRYTFDGALLGRLGD